MWNVSSTFDRSPEGAGDKDKNQQKKLCLWALFTGQPQNMNKACILATILSDLSVGMSSKVYSSGTEQDSNAPPPFLTI